MSTFKSSCVAVGLLTALITVVDCLGGGEGSPCDRESDCTPPLQCDYNVCRMPPSPDSGISEDDVAVVTVDASEQLDSTVETAADACGDDSANCVDSSFQDAADEHTDAESGADAEGGSDADATVDDASSE